MFSFQRNGFFSHVTFLDLFLIVERPRKGNARRVFLQGFQSEKERGEGSWHGSWAERKGRARKRGEKSRRQITIAVSAYKLAPFCHVLHASSPPRGG